MAEFASCYILVKGDVQGVGFRFYTSRLANSLGLKGYVRNLTTGDVEIEVEGYMEIIKTFLSRLQREAMRSYIVNLEVEWRDYQDKYESFDIKF